MRISDWSSDVCSSDLRAHFFRGRGVWKSFLLESGSYSFERRGRSAREFFLERNAKSHSGVCEQSPLRTDRAASDQFRDAPDVVRSEERRVGKESDSKCRSRWSP